MATVTPIRPEPEQARKHPPTTRDENSVAAADSMEAPAQRLRRQVYDLIQRWEPVATWELEELLNMSHQTVSARVWEDCTKLG